MGGRNSSDEFAAAKQHGLAACVAFGGWFYFEIGHGQMWLSFRGHVLQRGLGRG